ncbi:hypothetical protein QF002_000869 [Paraburkholderia youngii]
MDTHGRISVVGRRDDQWLAVDARRGGHHGPVRLGLASIRGMREEAAFRIENARAGATFRQRE